MRRTYAEHVEHTRSTDPNPPTKNNLPLYVSSLLQLPRGQFTLSFAFVADVNRIAVGTLMACVPFYYFYHSNKAPNSEKKAMAEARRNGGGPSTEYRDVRDSPVKTLEDKKKKEDGKL